MKLVALHAFAIGVATKIGPVSAPFGTVAASSLSATTVNGAGTQLMQTTVALLRCRPSRSPCCCGRSTTCPRTPLGSWTACARARCPAMVRGRQSGSSSSLDGSTGGCSADLLRRRRRPLSGRVRDAGAQAGRPTGVRTLRCHRSPRNRPTRRRAHRLRRLPAEARATRAARSRRAAGASLASRVRGRSWGTRRAGRRAS